MLSFAQNLKCPKVVEQDRTENPNDPQKRSNVIKILNWEEKKISSDFFPFLEF